MASCRHARIEQPSHHDQVALVHCRRDGSINPLSTAQTRNPPTTSGFPNHSGGSLEFTDTRSPVYRGAFLGSIAPAISGLPPDIMQSRKKVFEFTFVFVLGGADCFAHHAVQAIQLVAGEFDEVAFHRRVPLQS